MLPSLAPDPGTPYRNDAARPKGFQPRPMNRLRPSGCTETRCILSGSYYTTSCFISIILSPRGDRSPAVVCTSRLAHNSHQIYLIIRPIAMRRSCSWPCSWVPALRFPGTAKHRAWGTRRILKSKSSYPTLAPLVRLVMPAVVNISVESQVPYKEHTFFRDPRVPPFSGGVRPAVSQVLERWSPPERGFLVYRRLEARLCAHQPPCRRKCTRHHGYPQEWA